MSEEKKTGEPVRDLKGGTLAPATENKPAPKKSEQVQVHAGNIGPLSVHFLGEIAKNTARIAKCMEITLKENKPNG